MACMFVGTWLPGKLEYALKVCGGRCLVGGGGALFRHVTDGQMRRACMILGA
jgi:hypothetical protein